MFPVTNFQSEYEIDTHWIKESSALKMARNYTGFIIQTEK